jgi:hypothetical protein
MEFIYIVQVSYHVLSNAERRFDHAVSQALSYLSVKAQAQSQASPYKIGILINWHLERFFRVLWFAIVSISGIPRGVFEGFNPPSPNKFQSFDKAEPNSLFRGKYSKTCQVGHFHKLTTCLCWPHIGGTGEVPFSKTTSLTCPPFYIGHLSILATRNGTMVLF